MPLEPQPHDSLAANERTVSGAVWDFDRELDGLDGELDLLCPGCGHNLSASDAFATFRVCPACGRHFLIPARERLALVFDTDTFVEINARLVSVDPLRFQDDDASAVWESNHADGVGGGVLSGVGTIGGSPVVAIVLDLAALGGALGVVAGEKIALGLEHAHEHRLPTLLVCASGWSPVRSQDGTLGVAQYAKIAAAVGPLKRAGLPIVALATDPTTGDVFTGLTAHADILLAEPGAHLGPADQPAIPGDDRSARTADRAVDVGQIDGVVARPDLRQTLSTFFGLLHRRGSFAPRVGTPAPLPTASVPGRDSVSTARHPDRPTPSMLLDRMVADPIELRGDRVAADESGVRCVVGRLGGATVAVAAQGRATMSSAGVRKIERLMRLAGHFDLPVIVLVDSDGGAARDHWAAGSLAQTMQLATMLPVPIVSTIIGEAIGLSSMALCMGDRLLMLDHAVFSVRESESARRSEQPGSTSRSLTARECLRYGLIDGIVPEPSPAADADVAAAASAVEDALIRAIVEVRSVGSRRLLDERSRRLRSLGQTTPEARAAARREVLDLQELQRSLSRSLADWRERWEERSRLQQWRGRSQFHLPRPDLAGRIASLRGQGTGDLPDDPAG